MGVSYEWHPDNKRVVARLQSDDDASGIVAISVTLMSQRASLVVASLLLSCFVTDGAV